MISPSASVIMMKPMPVARSASTAKTAIDDEPGDQRGEDRGGMAEAGAAACRPAT